MATETNSDNGDRDDLQQPLSRGEFLESVTGLRQILEEIHREVRDGFDGVQPEGRTPNTTNHILHQNPNPPPHHHNIPNNPNFIPLNNGFQNNQNFQPFNNNNFRMKAELPEFKGSIDIEAFYDWEYETEKFFELTGVPEENKVNMVAYKLKGGAGVWWSGVQRGRRWRQEPPVQTWREMKRLMQKRFLPQDHEQILYQQFQNCRQGTRSICAYTDEFLRLQTRCALRESDVQQVARYTNGLKDSIRSHMYQQVVLTLDEAQNLALRIEKSLDLRSSSFRNRREETENQYPPMKSKESYVKEREVSKEVNPPNKTAQKSNGRPNSRTDNPYARPSNDKCFKCGEPGHRSDECRKRRPVNFAEGEDYNDDDDGFEVTEDVSEPSEDGDAFNGVVRRILLAPKRDESQRSSVFLTHCTIKDKVYNVIIDNGCTENIVSSWKLSHTLLRTRLGGSRRANRSRSHNKARSLSVWEDITGMRYGVMSSRWTQVTCF